jgi:predicted restriction endonuclease
MPSRTWTRDELRLALNLYCRLPFGQLRHGNPQVIALADKLGRTPSAVSMKLCNFASFDPSHGRRNVAGLRHSGHLDKEVWDEFNSNWEKAAYESQQRLVQLEDAIALPPEDDLTDEDLTRMTGRTTEATAKTRVRLVQAFFRRTVLVSYKSRCSFCGIALPQLLIASHIIPWKDSVERRADPRNGICLCALHDKAFDKGFLSIGEQSEILVSQAVKTANAPELHRVGLLQVEGARITLPYRFVPDADVIQYHRENVFRR